MPKTIRQYKLFYKRFGAPNFSQLEPIVHSPLYDKPTVQAAIEHMRMNPYIEGMAIRVEREMFNIMAFEQEAEAPKSFKFQEPPADKPESVVVQGGLAGDQHMRAASYRPNG